MNFMILNSKERKPCVGYVTTILEPLGTKFRFIFLRLLFILPFFWSCKESDIELNNDNEIVQSVSVFNDHICSCFRSHLLEDRDIEKCVFMQKNDSLLFFEKFTIRLESAENIYLSYRDSILSSVDVTSCVSTKENSVYRMISLIPFNTGQVRDNVNRDVISYVNRILFEELDEIELLTNIDRLAKAGEEERVSIARVYVNALGETVGYYVYEGHGGENQKDILTTIVAEMNSSHFMNINNLKEVRFPVSFFESDQLESWGDFESRIGRKDDSIKR